MSLSKYTFQAETLLGSLHHKFLMIDIKKHLQIALGYFLIIAFLGVLLRLFHIIDVPVNYRFMVHSHSHVALLGWLYTALSQDCIQRFEYQTSQYNGSRY